jgi:hypothetical protein
MSLDSQWCKSLAIPRQTAEYWLKAPVSELLCHDRADRFNTLDDERSALFNLLNLKTGLRLVAGNRFNKHQLALRQENDNYILYARKTYA